MTSPYRLLHIADPHFSECHFQQGTPSEIGKNQAKELEDALIEELDNHGPLDAIILSGDFSFACRPTGFEAAVVFIQRIARLAPRGNLLILPGNHDIDLSQQVPFGDLSLPTSKAEAEARFRDFLARVADYVAVPNHYLCNVIRIEGEGKPALILAGLNSCRMERYDAQGWGYIGADQIHHVYTKLLNYPALETRAKRGDLILAVTHHNLLPIWDIALRVLYQPPEKRKFSFVMDAAGTLNFLADLGVGAMLHGHTHVQSEKRVQGYGSGDSRENPLLILGTGTLGVAGQPASTPHHFRIIEIGRDFLKYRDFTANPCLPDSQRRWNRGSLSRGFVLRCRWDAETVKKVLKMSRAAAETARFDSENLESWSVLRVKALDKAAWPHVRSGLCSRVRAIEPFADDAAIERAIENM
jgi:3',5'-cyclic AMP phosphodiesterase CpdA